MIDVTPSEYWLLRFLLVRRGGCLHQSRSSTMCDTALRRAWRAYLRPDISCLRRRIDRHPPPLTQTVRGVGYVLRPPRV